MTRIYSFEVEKPLKTGGLQGRSKVMVNQSRAVDKDRLLNKLGHLPAEIMRELDKALKLHYELL